MEHFATIERMPSHLALRYYLPNSSSIRLRYVLPFFEFSHVAERLSTFSKTNIYFTGFTLTLCEDLRFFRSFKLALPKIATCLRQDYYRLRRILRRKRRGNWKKIISALPLRSVDPHQTHQSLLLFRESRAFEALPPF